MLGLFRSFLKTSLGKRTHSTRMGGEGVVVGEEVRTDMGASKVVVLGESIAVIDRIVSASTVVDIEVVAPTVTCLFEDVTFLGGLWFYIRLELDVVSLGFRKLQRGFPRSLLSFFLRCCWCIIF